MSKTIIQSIDQHMQNLLKPYTSSDFERIHYQDVVKYSRKLAYQRELDLETCLIIAMLHDIGRIQFGYTGKQHAKKGAIVSASILKNYPLTPKEINLIQTSISNHRKKSKVQNPYSELIKDADSLAHKDEFGTHTIKSSERIRTQLAEQPSLALKLKNITTYNHILLDSMKKISLQTEKLSNKSAKKNDIHELRVSIRQTKTLIWFYNLYPNKPIKELDYLDSILKKIFKITSPLRELQVYNPLLSKGSYNPLINSFFKKQIKKEKTIMTLKAAKLAQPVQEHLFQITEIINSIHFKNTANPGDTLLKLEQAYVNSINMSEVSSLHKLRIYGKKLKYLYELNLLHAPELFIKTINDLHEQIGLLHDLIGLQEYLKSKKVLHYFKKHNASNKLCFFYLESEIKKQKKIIEDSIFQLLLLLR